VEQWKSGKVEKWKGGKVERWKSVTVERCHPERSRGARGEGRGAKGENDCTTGCLDFARHDRVSRLRST
jgi:hypothetical protein